jgi:hypothetical protein
VGRRGAGRLGLDELPRGQQRTATGDRSGWLDG